MSSRWLRRAGPGGAAGQIRRAARAGKASPPLSLLIDTPGNHFHDLLAVKPAVLDEDRPRVDARQRPASDEQPRHVRLEGFRVVDRCPTIVELDSSGRLKIPVGVVA